MELNSDAYKRRKLTELATAMTARQDGQMMAEQQDDLHRRVSNLEQKQRQLITLIRPFWYRNAALLDNESGKRRQQFFAQPKWKGPADIEEKLVLEAVNVLVDLKHVPLPQTAHSNRDKDDAIKEPLASKHGNAWTFDDNAKLWKAYQMWNDCKRHPDIVRWKAEHSNDRSFAYYAQQNFFKHQRSVTGVRKHFFKLKRSGFAQTMRQHEQQQDKTNDHEQEEDDDDKQTDEEKWPQKRQQSSANAADQSRVDDVEKKKKCAGDVAAVCVLRYSNGSPVAKDGSTDAYTNSDDEDRSDNKSDEDRSDNKSDEDRSDEKSDEDRSDEKSDEKSQNKSDNKSKDKSDDKSGERGTSCSPRSNVKDNAECNAECRTETVKRDNMISSTASSYSDDFNALLKTSQHVARRAKQRKRTFACFAQSSNEVLYRNIAQQAEREAIFAKQK